MSIAEINKKANSETEDDVVIEEVPQSTRKYFPELTGLRGIAALWAALFHLQYAFGFSIDFYMKVFANRFVQKGYFAVDLFFVLSGFVIALTAHDWDGKKPLGYYPGFIRRRLARVYPVHVLTTLIMVAIYFATSESINWGASVKALAAHFALVHAWGTHYMPDWNFPSWSISAEWAAYLLFPILLPINRGISRGVIGIGFSILVAGAVLVYIATNYRNGSFDMTWDWGWARCLTQFWIGLSLYELYKQFADRVPKIARELISVVAIASIIALFAIDLADAWLLPVAGLLVFSVSIGASVWRAMFGNKVVLFLGDISYGIYMLHVPIALTFLNYFNKTLAPDQPFTIGLLVLLSALALLLVASAIMHWKFETPMRRRLAGR